MLWRENKFFGAKKFQITIETVVEAARPIEA